uniref:Thioredoxin domain-containing protein n=1 Tax=Coccolithus braarudii TaxID=221442 RepID=A0A7S0LNT7_9EUKA|mmetsp:Transcript_47433/g.101240  ORF Transcript_47433/g.101240 Transcript_47433/m.101240 type:complete len:477 (+) Transcript_47433:384-1814(+)
MHEAKEEKTEEKAKEEAAEETRRDHEAEEAKRKEEKVAREKADDFYEAGPYDDSPASLDVIQFEALVHESAAVVVNYMAPWCFWSNKLAPVWDAVARRLHGRAYSQSVKFLRIDCTTKAGTALCQKQAIHAFPSVRSYRGSTHAFEPYEHSREENVIWLHLVKLAAEVVVAKLKDLPMEDRKPFTKQISHISADLKAAMERRQQGLDEDWTDDALNAEEEVADDKELLEQMNLAAASIVAAKGEHHQQQDLGVHEGQLIHERSSDLVLGLLKSDSAAPAQLGPDGEALEPWLETETHEGCMLFGYLDVSRAPGTIHIAPHSPRHSFDFSRVNTSHHIDHLSFGLELGARMRNLLPEQVRSHLMPLDGSAYTTAQPHETQEHHVNIVPTSFSHAEASFPLETYQFTATSHARTKDTLPSLLISYDVSPIQVQIEQRVEPASDLIVSLCAIVGGAFTIFGILDAMLWTTSKAMLKKIA